MKLGKVGVIVSARTASTRLPGKALLPLGGKPMALFLLERLRAFMGGQIVLATTTLASDDRLVEVVRSAGISVFRGSPYDLVQRHYDLAKKFGFNTLVRVTADCPFVDAELIKYCLKEMSSIEDCDLVTTKGMFPVGLDAELFPVRVLQDLHLNGRLSIQDREHLTLHLYNNDYSITRLKPPANWPDSPIVFTVDTHSDYERVQQLLTRMNCSNFSLQDLLNLD